MSSIPPALPLLDNSSIHVGRLRSEARKQLIDAIDTRLGKKALVLDPKLSGPLKLICEFSVLKEHGVDKAYSLEPDLAADNKNVIYVVRPQMESMRWIADHIRDRQRRKQQCTFSVFFVPRRSTICEQVLEEEGVYADVTFGELPMDFIPYEEDVLSLELDTGLRDCLIDGDKSCLHALASALMRFQGMFGVVPNVKGKGHNSRAVADMLWRMRKEGGGKGLSLGPVDTMVLLDREVDMITPMCTQMTYEGLVDEEIGIRNGRVELNTAAGSDREGGGEGASSSSQPPQQQPGGGSSKQRRVVVFNSSDPLSSEYRDLNTGEAMTRLGALSRTMFEDYKEVKGTSQVAEIRSLKNFAGTLKKMYKPAERHVEIGSRLSAAAQSPSFRARAEVEAELVDGRGLDEAVEHAEAMMGQGAPMVRVLRVLCLASLTHGGIPKKAFDHLRREVLQAYGYEHMPLLGALEAAGLLKRGGDGGKAAYPALKRALKLLTDDPSDGPGEAPVDITFCYSTGYAALSVRLVQRALQAGGWRAIEDQLKLLPGPHFELVQAPGEGGGGSELSTPPVPSLEAGQRKVVLVVLIGGITFAEISALRWLSAGSGHDIIVATTKLINGSSMLESLAPP